MLRTSLKIGTRSSWLALTQARWVKAHIELVHPEIKVELVEIQTQGDQILDRPLSELPGKDFFVKELDQALLGEKVDLTVHSHKDLSVERPEGLVLAAIPVREDPRDVLILSETVLSRLASNSLDLLKIGTSSPRRQKLVYDFLIKKLFLAPRCSIQMVSLRGNVPTRLGKLNTPSSGGDLDGVVLAAAGVNRLLNEASYKESLLNLLKNTRVCYLPLSENPTTPAQGALAIECRSKDEELKELLEICLSHSTAILEVTLERTLMKKYGGGCHQKYGITAKSLDSGIIVWEKGEAQGVSFSKKSLYNHVDGHYECKVESSVESSSNTKIKLMRQQKVFRFDRYDDVIQHHGIVFIAHAEALETLEAQDLIVLLRKKRIWAPGLKTWERLSRLGVFVEGCTDGLGIETLIQEMKPCSLLNRDPLDNLILVLTSHRECERQLHLERETTAPTVKYLGFYDAPNHSTGGIDTPVECAGSVAYFWKTHFDYLEAKPRLDPRAIHGCGPGKTAKALMDLGVDPLHVFPDEDLFYDWLRKRN